MLPLIIETRDQEGYVMQLVKSWIFGLQLFSFPQNLSPFYLSLLVPSLVSFFFFFLHLSEKTLDILAVIN